MDEDFSLSTELSKFAPDIPNEPVQLVKISVPPSRAGKKVRR